MPLSVPQTILDKSLEQHGFFPWVWLYEFTADVTGVATSVFRLTSSSLPVTFDRQDGDGAGMYQPFAIEQGRVRENREGDLLATEVTVGNATQDLTYWMLREDGTGFINLPVIVCIAHRLLLADGPALRLDMTVAEIDLTNLSATFRLQSPNYFRQKGPRHIFVRDQCRHQFKGNVCAYRGALAECNRTLERCIEIGADEAANGLAVQHPLRFGGMPGMLRRT